MSNKSEKTKQNNQMPLALGLLVIGILVANVLSDNRVIQALGLVLILVSVVILSANFRRSKK